MYRGTWLLVALPLLAAAFSVQRPAALPAPTLPPAFDESSALSVATELSGLRADRRPGSPGAASSARWLSARLAAFGLRTRSDAFTAVIPGVGRVRLENLIAEVPALPARHSEQAIVVMAHRDDVGNGPGANDNASGTAALVELARAYANPADASLRPVTPAHRIVFLSTDGGAYGGLGAERFSASPDAGDVGAVINLDAVAGRGPPRIELSGDEPLSPPGTLLRTAAARILDQTGAEPERPSALRQLVDLGFPFSLYEQAPFVARGIPALTLTTASDRPPASFSDTVDKLDERRLGELGRAAQGLLGSLDAGLELTRGGSSSIYLGARIVRGWAVELVLIAALLPFLFAAVDLFARCRRRRIHLAPAFRSLRTRLAFWLFAGLVFQLFAVLGAWPGGAARPLAPESAAARSWPLLGLTAFGLILGASWLVARQRLLPRRAVRSEEQLAGYTATLLAVGVIGLLVVATNPFALVFVLPSLHAWIWLPQLRGASPWARAGVFALGLGGPLLLLASFAGRFGLSLDAPWYISQLVSVGYVPFPAPIVFLLWLAAAGQLVALAAGRYAPYPDAAERPPRGPIRELVRTVALAARAHRRPTEPARDASYG